MGGASHAGHAHAEEGTKVFGMPVSLLKNPVVTLLIGLSLAGGGKFVWDYTHSNEPASVSAAVDNKKLDEMQRDIQSLREDRAETKAQVQGLKEQATRIETKLDRLLERSLYNSARR